MKFSTPPSATSATPATPISTLAESSKSSRSSKVEVSKIPDEGGKVAGVAGVADLKGDILHTLGVTSYTSRYQETSATLATSATPEVIYSQETSATLATSATPEVIYSQDTLATLATSATPEGTLENKVAGVAGVAAPFTLASPETATPASAILERLQASVIYLTDPGRAQATVDRLLTSSEKISRYPGACGGMYGLDIETMPLPQWRNDAKAGLDPYRSSMRLIQIFDPVGTCYVFDLKSIPLETIKPLLESRETVAHNALFEMKHLRYAGIHPLRLHCTLLMARVASGKPLLPLAKTAEQYLSDLSALKIDKSLQVSNWSAETLTQEQIDYAALDAVLARELWRELKAIIQPSGQAPAYRRMAAVIPIVADQILAGVPFDAETHRQWVSGWQAEQLPLRDQLERELGINPDSSAQLSGWLEKHLDPVALKAWPKTPTGRLKTDEEAFDRIDLPALSGLRRYKHLSKKISTFGHGYLEHLHPVTKRIHADFAIAGTLGGRFNCGKPNLQQAPAGEFRQLFKAPPGYQCVVADYSQIELRIAAIMAGDSTMLEAYRQGADLHRLTAAAIAGVPETAVTPAMRQLAKACNFGLIYGMSAATLAIYAASGYGVVMTLKEAEQAKRAFFTLYPGLSRWQSQTKVRGLRDSTVKTVGGLIRDFSAEPGGWQLTKALNSPVQGTGAEILLSALAALPQHLSGLEARLILHVHDEIVLEVIDKDVEHAKAALVSAMEAGWTAIFPEHPMAGLVEAHSGDNWYAAKG